MPGLPSSKPVFKSSASGLRFFKALSLLGTALVGFAGCGTDYNVVGEPPIVNPEDVTDCPFSEIPGTQFQRYDCNPVFTNTDEEWVRGNGGVGALGFHAENVLGQPFYQMWYTTEAKGGTYGVGYAISSDGTTWTPLPDNPVWEGPDGGWNTDDVDTLTPVWDSNLEKYVIAYHGMNFGTGGNGLGILTSSDGRTWEEANNGQPVLDLAANAGTVHYCWPLALTWDAEDGYRGFIAGNQGFGSDICEIYAYGGPDIDHIKPEEGAVLSAGPEAYDQMGMAGAAVVKFDGLYYMFYVGIRSWEPLAGYTGSWQVATNTTLNLATSQDGVHWEKSPGNPITEVSLLDDPYVIGSVGAQVVGDRIHLWIDDWYEEERAIAVGYFLFEPYADPY